MAKIRMIYICTANACRSQFAEAITNHFFQDIAFARSAGIKISTVHPYTIKILQEKGIDTSNLFSKHLKEFQEEKFDYVITVCDNANKQCPIYYGGGKRLHWPIDDPASFHGEENEKIKVFEKTYEEIKEKIENFLKNI